ncbi:hypothetical protein [Streptomyces sp. S1]|uniref:hypothetical protein n=1 Tax=Streptomyces sp. S1 TaxID=718288 RepID=UPI003D705FA8
MRNEDADPLMLALSDEPLPEGAANDPEVARALADVAVLREQLALVGRVLADRDPQPPRPAPADQDPRSVPVGQDPQPAPPAQDPSPAPARIRPRRRRFLAWTLAASVAVAALGVGGAYLAAHGGDTDGDEAKLTPAGVVACSTDVAEGTVTRVEPLPGTGEFRVVLRVDRTYKPVDGPRRLTFDSAGSGTEAGEPYFRPGARVLVLVPASPGQSALTFREGAPPPGEEGEDVGPVRDELEYGRKWLESALPEAADLECEGNG